MKKTVWVIDDDDSIRWVLDKALGQAGIPIKAFDSADEAMHLFPNELPLTVLSDIRMPGSSGLDFLQKIQAEFPNHKILFSLPRVPKNLFYKEIRKISKLKVYFPDKLFT